MAVATIAKIRSLLSAPDGVDTEIVDADITNIIADESDLYRAAALCAQAIAAKYANQVNGKTGPLSKDRSDKYTHWMGVALMMRNSRAGTLDGAPVVTGTSVAAIAAARANTDRVPSPFRAGQFDPPSVG